MALNSISEAEEVEAKEFYMLNLNQSQSTLQCRLDFDSSKMALG